MRLFLLLIAGSIGVSVANATDLVANATDLVASATDPVAYASDSPAPTSMDDDAILAAADIIPPASVMASYEGSARQVLATHAAVAEPAEASPKSLQPAAPAGGGRKSPKKAFFLSLLVPGLGEYYAGHAIRGSAFLAIEGAAWTAWGIYRGRGNDWQSRYIAYQAEHWNFARYDAYRHAVWDYVARNSNFFDPSRPFTQRQQDSLTVLIGTHHYDDICGQPMPSKDDQYEMIGKYNRFVYGWDDATVFDDSTMLLRDIFPAPGPGSNGVWGTDTEDWRTIRGGELVRTAADDNGVYQVRSPETVQSAHRDEYMSMRQKSNDAFGIAKTMTTVVVFNHVVSAIQAARLARAASRGEQVELPTSGVDLALRPFSYAQGNEYALVPMVTIWRRF